MEREQTIKITGLIKKLMTGEAREIYVKDKPIKKNRKYNQCQKVDIEGIKRQITDYIKESNLVLNPESVKRYALSYLHEHEEIATSNSSFGILRQRIERGEYDFSFVTRQQ